MSQTRRGFLELLAHMPLVGAWLAKRPGGFSLDPRPELPDEMEIDGVSYQKYVPKTCRLIRWIPVTERLPHEGRDVLWWDAESPHRLQAIDHWTRQNSWDRKAKEWLPDLPIDLCSGLGTHWAELPAPPEVHE